MQDIAALVEASKRSNVGGGRAACQALSDASPQGSPEAGFTLTLNKEGLFETDADNLPDVWLRVLPQVSTRPRPITLLTTSSLKSSPRITPNVSYLATGTISSYLNSSISTRRASRQSSTATPPYTRRRTPTSPARPTTRSSLR